MSLANGRQTALVESTFDLAASDGELNFYEKVIDCMTTARGLQPMERTESGSSKAY
jgi:hypothetical protein